MLSNPNPFGQACKLLSSEPLRADIIDQLDRLRKQVPYVQCDQFDQLYEGAVVALSTQDIRQAANYSDFGRIWLVICCFSASMLSFISA